MEEQEFRDYQKKTQKDYSLAFKLSIVDAVDKGELNTRIFLQTKIPAACATGTIINLSTYFRTTQTVPGLDKVSPEMRSVAKSLTQKICCIPNYSETVAALGFLPRGLPVYSGFGAEFSKVS